MKGKVNYEKIKDRRNEIDMTQKELADATEINLSLIKAIETGRSDTSYENIEKIASVLNIDSSEIFLKDFKETKIISIANNKGGSGKTTVTGCIGYSLSQMGYKVLLIDADMQMNLTYSFALERNEEKNIFNAIKEEENLLEYIISTEHENIDFIISDFNMATIEMLLFTKMQRESIFRQIVDPVVKKGIYDYIIIDTNPTLGILNFNILNASDYVIIPVELSRFGIEGLDILLNFFKDVKKINNNLKIAGVLLNKVDLRESITKEANEVIKEIFGDIIFNTYISTDTKIKKSQWESVPLNIFDSNSRAAKQYKELSREVIKIVK